MMPLVAPFPFDNLPKYSAAEVALRKRISHAYDCLEGHADMISDLLEPLKAILKSDLSMNITQVTLCTLEEIQATLPANALLGVVTIEPRLQKAVLVFDVFLAKLLVHKVLSGDQHDREKMLELQTKPLTILEEAIVQYVFVSMIERFANNRISKNFHLNYEGVSGDQGLLNRSFAKMESFAVFSLHIQVLERDFSLKFLLPVKVADETGLTKIREESYTKRLKQFGRFDVHFSAEVARVTLEPSDLERLSEGDIILFDEYAIRLQDGRVSGRAEVMVGSEDEKQGFLVDLDHEGEQLRAKIIAGL